MGSDLPSPLAALLDGPDPAARHAAWPAFLNQYNRLLLKAAGSFGGDYDGRMDRYRHLVEALSADDYRRLRGYRVDSKSSFAAWLTVVSRRLCVDFERSRSGRADRVVDGTAGDRRKIRRRLLDLTGTVEDPDSLASSKPGAAEALETEERRAAVERALGELPPRDRLLVKLRFEDDLSVREIADVMGFPSVFHVYRRLRPVLESIRGTLVAQGFNDASA